MFPLVRRVHFFPIATHGHICYNVKYHIKTLKISYHTVLIVLTQQDPHYILMDPTFTAYIADPHYSNGSGIANSAYIEDPHYILMDLALLTVLT
jgi:hypothetical protein